MCVCNNMINYILKEAYYYCFCTNQTHRSCIPVYLLDIGRQVDNLPKYGVNSRVALSFSIRDPAT